MRERESAALPPEVVRRWIEAFNARDLTGFLALATADLEIRNPLGNAFRGAGGAREFLTKNEEMDVRVVQDGQAHIDGNRVVVPTVMRMSDGTEIRSAGVFELRGGRVARLHIVIDRSAVGLSPGSADA